MSKSKSEELLALHLKAHKIPFTREVRFHPERKWRLDFAIDGLKLGVEVQGITHFGKNANGSMKLGAHQSAKGIERDMEKYGEAQVLGWTVYCCSQGMIKSGKAIDTILKLIEMKKEG